MNETEMAVIARETLASGGIEKNLYASKICLQALGGPNPRCTKRPIVWLSVRITKLKFDDLWEDMLSKVNAHLTNGLRQLIPIY